MKLQHLSLVALIAMMLGALSSCSKSEDIIDTVPADAACVATVNLDRLCSAGGISLTADETKVAPEMEKAAGGPLKELIDGLSAIKDAIDIENIVIALDTDNVTYVTFAVKDLDKLCGMTAGNLTWEGTSGDYKSAHLHELDLLATSSQGWIVRGSDNAAKAVDEFTKRAKERPISDIEYIGKALSRDNIMNIAVTSGFTTLSSGSTKASAAPLDEKEWNIASINISDGNSLVAEWEMARADGEAIAPQGMQDINPALLAYVPENFNVTFAAGLTPGFDWEPLHQLATIAGGFQAAAFLSVVDPYLTSINGTVLLAAAPGADGALTDGDPYEWDFIALVNMPQDKIAGLCSIIRSMMSTAGIAPRMTDNGIMMIPQYGKTLYIGNVNGYFGISTIGFDNTRNNPLASTFTGKEMALSVDLSSVSPLFDSVGLELNASMSGGKGSAKLSAPGTQTPILVFLMTGQK